MKFLNIIITHKVGITCMLACSIVEKCRMLSDMQMTETREKSFCTISSCHLFIALGTVLYYLESSRIQLGA
jgi:hypothetical protein